jgi:glutaredoxin 3
MNDVIIYSSENCPYCVRAKQLFDQKQIPYTEIRVDLDPAQRDLMMERSGRRTVPQIFINEHHVGGCDDLMALVSAGKLDDLLQKK